MAANGSANSGDEVSWWRAEGALTVRQEADGASDRVADFLQDDVVQGDAPLHGEWLRVNLDGAVRFEGCASVEVAHTEEPCTQESTNRKHGFVRVKNRFRQLLRRVDNGHDSTMDDEDNVVKLRWKEQVRARAKELCWFRPPPQSPATAAQYQRPLLQGGQEEFERRWEIQAAVTRIVASKNLRAYGPEMLKADLRLQFDGADWLEPMLAQRSVVVSLLSTAVAELPQLSTGASAGSLTGIYRVEEVDEDEEPATQVGSVSREAGISGDPMVAEVGAIPQSNHQRLSAPRRPLTLVSLGVPLAASAESHDLAPIILDTLSFTELLARTPWRDYSAIAATDRAAAIAVRGANWQRLAEVLAEQFGLLTPRLLPAHVAGPTSAEGWKAFFFELWDTRSKWSTDRQSSEGFRVRSVVRFRPGKQRVEGSSHQDGHGHVFLPLHQRLQLVKLGHDSCPGFKEEVAHRMGARPSQDVGASEADTATNSRSEAPNVEGEAGLDSNAGCSEHGVVRTRVLSTEDKRVLVSLPGMGLRYFDFESVCDERHGQAEVYAISALPALESLLRGVSTCVMCYGPTGSGKTHTMFGGADAYHGVASCIGIDPRARVSTNVADAKQPAPGDGLAPRLLRDLLCAVAARPCVLSTVTLSYVEIYNDRLTDLLSGEDVTLFRIGQGAAASEHRDLFAGLEADEIHFQLSGAVVKEVSDPEDALAALADAEARKSRAATILNARSSRAHAVLMVGLTQRHRSSVLRSHLSMVDLGGSEQVKKSKAEGQRFEEAVEINTSLMVLGRVVDALVQKRTHVPYYESRLTMLLQPALGGKAQTTVVVTASPEDEHGEETVHALRFGERCSQLTNEAQASTASMADVVAALEANIAACERQVASLEARGAALHAQLELSDAGLRGLGFGHGSSRLVPKSHDDGTSGQDAALSSVKSYTHVEDLAGDWLVQKDRLKMLLQRRREICGSG
eukprot:TRINITY_DN43904_c0_g1_i1.p1 TRINITY_DN43904_c0_g1~~TRINITY_DN43904_c0_g1_i1.p1  ORF type:complete len:965 (+),score=139.00 TRINITY_DN43904_c0_g1_i1:92-2986(+)